MAGPKTQWQDRTEGGRKRAILIDEYTGDWCVADGRLQWDSTSVSQVYHAIMTKIGTIPTSPFYGSEIHKAWKITGTMPREMRASLLSALKPLEDNGVIKAGSADIEVEHQGGYLTSIMVMWTDGGGQKQDCYIPIQPGFYT